VQKSVNSWTVSGSVAFTSHSNTWSKHRFFTTSLSTTRDHGVIRATSYVTRFGCNCQPLKLIKWGYSTSFRFPFIYRLCSARTGHCPTCIRQEFLCCWSQSSVSVTTGRQSATDLTFPERLRAVFSGVTNVSVTRCGNLMVSPCFS